MEQRTFYFDSLCGPYGGRKLKLLVVDDNADRVRKLWDFLGAIAFEDPLDIVIVNNAEAARDELSDSYFDLLILDIVIPRDCSDASPDASKSLDLLIEVVETGNLVKPGYVLGITAFQDAHDEVSKTFASRTWSVLYAAETSSDWLDKLRACIDYIAQVRMQRVVSGFGLDVLILTALRSPEMDAVHRLPWEWKAERPIDDVTFVRDGLFYSGRRAVTVCTAVAPRMGLVPMAITAGKLISIFKPQLVVMPGICAGVREKVELGDVVFAELSWDYQVGKHHVSSDNVSTFAIEPYSIQSDASVAAKMDQLARDDSVWAAIAQGWVERKRPPRLVRAPMASGSAVLADSSITELIVRQQRKVAAIEMEVYALYSASELAPHPRPISIGLKSVCDFADNSKDDSVQAYAAYVSAEATRSFLERYAIELLK